MKPFQSMFYDYDLNDSYLLLDLYDPLNIYHYIISLNIYHNIISNMTICAPKYTVCHPIFMIFIFPLCGYYSQSECYLENQNLIYICICYLPLKVLYCLGTCLCCIYLTTIYHMCIDIPLFLEITAYSYMCYLSTAGLNFFTSNCCLTKFFVSINYFTFIKDG